MAALGAQGRRLVWGAGCTAVVGVVADLVWGRTGGLAAAAFGGVATAVQFTAARLMARTGRNASVDHVRVYVAGVGVRLLGILVLGVVVSLDRRTFPPVPSAAGYLGTVLPLLYLETRLSRC
jgi:MFS family permease